MTLGDTSSYAERAELATTWASAAARGEVPIRECGEELVDLGTACPNVIVNLRIPARLVFVGAHRLSARATVAGLLNHLSSEVSPHKLLVFDAFRPIAYQRVRHEAVYQEKKRLHPSWSEEQLSAATDAQVAIPSSLATSPPPHATGGAVDVLLLNPDGSEMDFGSTPGVYNSDRQDSSHPTNAPGLQPSQREARLLLLRAATACGFANFPGEWWHYSYGDQEWALYTGRSEFAMYGSVDSE